MLTRVGILVFLALSLFGCESYPVHPYSVSGDNVAALRKVAVPMPVSVGPIAAAAFPLTCRGTADIEMPAGQTVGTYVQDALRTELQVAGFTVTDAVPPLLTGQVSRADVKSIDEDEKWVWAGQWAIDVTLRSSNGKVLTGSIVHRFPTSFHGQGGCALTAAAFMPAVQKLIGNLVRSPQFPELLQ